MNSRSSYAPSLPLRGTKMRNKDAEASLWVNPYLWRLTVVMVACSILYYLPEFAGLAGWVSLRDTLGGLHDFYGLDFYALVFFGPVVYAAYGLGVRGAVITALVCMLALFPYAILVAPYPNALFRPTAFAIILSAVGAAIAMLQRGDEQRRRNMSELMCLHDIGRAVEESDSIKGFVSSVIRLIPQAMLYPSEIGIRVVVRDKVFQSRNFQESANRVVEDLIAGTEVVGRFEIYRARSRPSLEGQYPLIRTLAERVGGAVRRIELEQSLKVYYEQLEDMVEERTRDLEQTQGQLRLLSNTVMSSIDGITLADMEGNLTFANEAGQRMWSYSLEEMTQMKMSRLYSADECELVEREVIPGSRGGVWDGELTAMRQDGGQFPVLVTTSPVYDEKGEIVAIVGVHRDITETKEMRDKLIRSERLAAVGELASGVGHELRNPLNVMRNCVYLLNMGVDNLDETNLKTLKLLDQQVDIANKIVTDLLNFTRIRPPSLAGVDLNNLIRESLSWVSLPEGVAVMTDIDGDSPQVRADAEQVGRVFANIISNAAQAMNGKGELRISTGVADGCAWVSFKDDGCGIPEDNLDKIFEPLFTTKPKGIGLGLAISKRLIEQNNGNIEVASQVAEGTTFTIRLPASDKEGDQDDGAGQRTGS